MNNQQVQRELVIWKVEHDRCLVRELLLVEPHAHKQQTSERGEAWKLVIDNLNAIEGFHVSVRAVRERFTKLFKKCKNNEREEARAAPNVVYLPHRI